MDWTPIIESRCSCRNFTQAPLTEQLIQEIKTSLDSISSLYGPSARVQFWQDDGTVVSHMTMGYGKLTAPPQFLLGIAQPSPQAMEEMGYQMEQAILHMTRLGLATLWIGGAVDQIALTQALSLKNGEEVLVICPVGYAKSGVSSLERISKTMSYLLTGNKRKPYSEWLFYENWGSPAEEFLARHPQWAQIFHGVRLAPSWVNIQPWRFLIRGENIYAFVEATGKDRWAGNIRNGKDYKTLDLGIALSHFDLLAKQFGLLGHWEPWDGEGCNVPPKVQGLARWVKN